MKAHPPFTCKATRPFPAKGDCGITAGDDYGWELYTKSIFCRGQSVWDSGQLEMQNQFTGNQKMSPGFPVQGSCHTGCNTGSTGSDSGSTVATAERTGWRQKKKWWLIWLSELYFLHLLLWFWEARTIFLVREGVRTCPGHTLWSS